MRASVTIQEWDLSTRVPSFPGVYGAIVMPSKKGEVNKAVLTTDETSLLKRCTPDETIKVGYDTSYYSALAFLLKSNKLWTVRAAQDAKHGGVTIGQRRPLASHTVSSVDPDTNTLTLSHITDEDFLKAQSYFKTCTTGERVRLSVSAGGTLPDGLAVNTDYYSIEFDDENFRIQLASSFANAGEGIPITLTDAGSGTITIEIQGYTYNSSVEYSMTEPANYDLNSSNGKPSGMESKLTPNHQNDRLVVDATFFSWIKTGDKVKIRSDDTLPTGLDASLDYYVIKSRVLANTIRLATTKANAETEVFVAFTDDGTLAQPDAFHWIQYNENTELVGAAKKCLLIAGKDPGVWNNDLYISLVNYPYIPWDGDTTTWTEAEEAAASLVKEPDCFLITVYKRDPDGNVYAVENPWLCSRIKDKKDGYGQNCYVEDVLEGSNYIRAYDNTTIHESIKPLDQYDLVAMTPEYLKIDKGDDGTTVTDSTMLRALDALKSRRDIACTVIMDGGWATPAYQKQGILQIAENRKDCVGILSFPIAAEFANDYMTELLKYRKYTLNANSSYGSIFSPHLQIQDKYNDRKIWVAPDGYVGAAISATASNNEIWFPPAGPRRGVLNVLDTAVHFTEGDQDVLYDNGINPIDFYPGRGIRIWGQKTLLARPSALDRLNVRLLLITIEPAIAEFLEDFLFEINDEITRALASSGVASYMEGIKARRGVYAFKVKCDSENNPPEVIDANEMNVWLFVQPTKAIEFIKFTVIITRTGGSFSLSGTVPTV